MIYDIFQFDSDIHTFFSTTDLLSLSITCRSFLLYRYKLQELRLNECRVCFPKHLLTLQTQLQTLHLQTTTSFSEIFTSLCSSELTCASLQSLSISGISSCFHDIKSNKLSYNIPKFSSLKTLILRCEDELFSSILYHILVHSHQLQHLTLNDIFLGNTNILSELNQLPFLPTSLRCLTIELVKRKYILDDKEIIKILESAPYLEKLVIKAYEIQFSGSFGYCLAQLCPYLEELLLENCCEDIYYVLKKCTKLKTMLFSFDNPVVCFNSLQNICSNVDISTCPLANIAFSNVYPDTIPNIGTLLSKLAKLQQFTFKHFGETVNFIPLLQNLPLSQMCELKIETAISYECMVEIASTIRKTINVKKLFIHNLDNDVDLMPIVIALKDGASPKLEYLSISSCDPQEESEWSEIFKQHSKLKVFHLYGKEEAISLNISFIDSLASGNNIEELGIPPMSDNCIDYFLSKLHFGSFPRLQSFYGSMLNDDMDVYVKVKKQLQVAIKNVYFTIYD